MEYLVIYFGEDGMTITPMDQKKLNKLMDDIVEEGIDHPTERFVKAEDKRFYMDGGEYPLYKYMIIKGESILPKISSSVTKMTV